MLRRAALLCSLLALPCTAVADVPVGPSELWGSPSPRTVPDAEGQRRAVGLVHLEWMRGEALPPEGRDPVVEMRSERLELLVLRNVVWIRAEVVVRAREDLSSWSMGIAEHAYRDSSFEMHFFEVRVDDELVPTFERSVPVRPPEELDANARDGFDAWREWRLDLERGRDVTVRFELVRPTYWYCPDYWRSIEQCPEATHARQRLHYARHDADRFARGPGPLEVVVRGPDGASLTRTVATPTDTDRFRAESVEVPLNEAFTLEGRDAVNLVLDAPTERAPTGAEVPAWLDLLDRSLRTDEFSPRAVRSVAPGFDAAGFHEHVEELRALSSDGDPRTAAVARGLLEALRERLRWTVDRADSTYDSEDALDAEGAVLPAADQVGPFGTRLDTDDWRAAVQAAMDWTTPPGQSPITFRTDDPYAPVPPSKQRAHSEHTEEPTAEETRDTLLRLLDDRYQRPTSSGAQRPDTQASARAIGLEAGPPFGLPNQLVRASMNRTRAWELPAVMLTLVFALGAAYMWRNRLKKRARRN